MEYGSNKRRYDAHFCTAKAKPKNRKERRLELKVVKNETK